MLQQKQIGAIEKYLIASEKHKDGSDHLHVYLKLEKKKHVRDVNFFDLDNQKFHGNYQSCRNAEAVVKYCKKDGNYVSNFDLIFKKLKTVSEYRKELEEQKGDLNISAD